MEFIAIAERLEREKGREILSVSRPCAADCAWAEVLNDQHIF
jgi:hypothetical protein